jgi:XTP/dITP diphosphohydrolase
VVANDEETVKANWEKLKLKEGNKSVLEGVPRSLPSLVKAYRIQDKVRGVGFDWDHADQVWEKVKEELDEFKEELDQAETADPDKVSGEFGDLLFSLINFARFHDINPDEALERTNRKFQTRFQAMEEEIAAKDLDLTQMDLAEMDIFWDAAKAATDQKPRT